jgi:hypothetical protein
VATAEGRGATAFPPTRLLRAQTQHESQLSQQTLASPALVDGRWHIRTASHLLVIRRKSIERLTRAQRPLKRARRLLSARATA